MKVKDITLIILFLVSSKLAFNQSDLSILFSTDDYTKLTLEYRKPIFEKMRFKIGFTMGGSSTRFNSGLGSVRVENDTIVQTFLTSNENRFGLKFGLERQIKSSVFYYGLDLFTGYQTRHSNYYRTYTPVDADSSDVFLYTIGKPGSSRTSNFLSIGGLASIGMNLTISERFLFNASVGMGVEVNQFLSVLSVEDPLNVYTYPPRTNSTISMFATVGLRYKLIKKEK